MPMTRRDWLYLAGQTTLLAQGSPASADPQRHIEQIIHAYEEQGIHRTGTKVDQAPAIGSRRRSGSPA
jgi:hypothetical protein